MSPTDKVVWFTENEYSKILDGLVIVCVDTVVYDSEGRVLLGLRNKQPIKGWWIFGGRMRANESFTEAAKRGLMRELSIRTTQEPKIVGYYDLRWDTREEAPSSNGCHVLLVAMKYKLDSSISINQIDSSHEEIRWFSQEELRSENLNDYLNSVLKDANLF
ncbi:NUDIX domain-containing protein [Candidatus Nomurabacteria bacterium]|nr:NUDIX domain-containing protein [Candidatus Nomurabacteria bacterium]